MKKQLMIFLLCMASVVSAEDMIEISRKELNRYWIPDDDRIGKNQIWDMLNFLNVINQRNGDYSYYSYDYVIDVDGYPKQFKFIDASPKEGLQDEKLLKKSILAYRYKPVTATPQKVKVHVINGAFGKPQAQKEADRKDPKYQESINRHLANLK